MKSKMDGKSIGIIDMNLALFGDFDPDIPMDGEKAFEEFKLCFPKLEPIKGQTIIMGTGGELNSNESFSKLWQK